MCPIAIIGAAGFVGTRLIETCLLSGITGIRPVVRNNYNLARLCRFGLYEKVRIADAENEQRVLEAVQGFPVVVNLMSGDPAGIVQSTRAIHEACVKGGVRRLIHLSSAVVYGQVDSPDLHDDSPLVKDHWMPYARAKISAEQLLSDASGKNPLEIVMLRPGIVWGPRSRWSFNAASALKANSAFLVGDGSGICDTIYIDNLVACILACCDLETELAGAYNVADAELVTWADFYASLADFAGYDMAKMPTVAADRFHPSLDSLLQDFASTQFYHILKRSISVEQRAKIKRMLSALRSPKAPAGAPLDQGPPKIEVQRDMWNLQKTRYKLPTRKFEEKLGFTPPVSFQEGTRMTINWLRFLGL
jgi:2-alkyl-3-oxoalkanoate reductase